MNPLNTKEVLITLTKNTNNMNAIETFIYTLETQLKTMPNGYVRETVTACKELAEGIKVIYENNSNITNQPTNQD